MPSCSPQSFKLDCAGKSDSPNTLYPLSRSAATDVSLARERGFPSLAHTPVPEWGRQLLGLPELASSVSSSIHTPPRTPILTNFHPTEETVKRLWVLWIRNTARHFCEDQIIPFHWRLRKHFTLCGPCIVAKMTELNGEQRDMISPDKLQEAGAPGNRKPFLLYAFKHFT